MLKVSIMLCSPPKYLFSIEIEISAIVLSRYLKTKSTYFGDFRFLLMFRIGFESKEGYNCMVCKTRIL